MKSLHLIINPNAGTRQGRRFLPEMISIFNRAGYLCSVYVTEKRGDAVDFARAHAGEADLVVACGGDGTLNEVITGLQLGRHKPSLGYIPCGSTNDFASGLELPLAPLLACDSIVLGNPRPLDVGLFGSDRYFSYTASFGAFTSVSWSTSQNVKNVLGHAAYILEGIRSLADIHPIHMKVTADGHEYEDDYIFGAVCNSTSLGGVLKLDDSEVHMSDGLFEALLIPFPPDLLVLNRILTALRTHCYDDPSLYFLRASSFVFEGAPEITWTLDGEAAEGTSRVEIKNIHNAISLIY
ncbi:diacylglycerol/lipid kinase family protein [Aristaeella lactis]|uniref:diacylglycerol/lipid kinase family protein n=1 Tax=Aristaeella lactis TaxID=3046383 RepID=UPI0015C43EF9|nr:YegS/Rv2252/BmrU family lipid kinase [Aristaeella lactis]QUA54446.1 YegS/Rv2252/BmrU family lipid kinase [Aristaeella lactis]